MADGMQKSAMLPKFVTLAPAENVYGSLAVAVAEPLALEQPLNAFDGTDAATVVVPCKNAATGSDAP